MAFTSAHTRTYASTAAMANLAVHNKRAFDEDHPAPWYLLAEEHRDSRGNVGIETGLTPEMVLQEYLETNKFGKKHGRLHHRAKPLRETVVVCEARHGREDMEKLMAELERRLPFRCMYGYLHRDEGYIQKDTGKVVRNYHMHIGHTNLVDGQLVDPRKSGLRELQDICAAVLGMERGTPAKEGEDRKPHLNPAEYRRMAKEKEKALVAEQNKTQAAEQEIVGLGKELNNRNQILSTENERLKGELARSNAARVAGEQAFERLKNDPDLDLGPGLDTIEDLAASLAETNKALRKHIQESGQSVPAPKPAPAPSPGVTLTHHEVRRQRIYEAAARFNAASQTPTQALQDGKNRAKLEYDALGKLNKAVREGLKATGKATREDYQAWKKTLNDRGLSATQKTDQAFRLLEEVHTRLIEATEQLETEKKHKVKTQKDLNKLQSKHETLDKEYKDVLDFFQPLFSLWNSIVTTSKDDRDPLAWLDDVFAMAREKAQKYLPQQKESGGTVAQSAKTESSQATSQDQKHQGRQPGD